MTYDEWREGYFSGPLMNEAMARAAWNAATSIEREACAKLCDNEKPANPWKPVSAHLEGQFEMAGHLAELIRARGNQ